MFLRQEVKLEPLVCSWYAWTHLVPPAQHAMNIAYRHLPLMSSFIRNPAVHVAAAKDRSLFGGPFMHLSTDCVPQVRQLMEETEARCERLICLAKDLKELDRQLQETATGYSLSEFYTKIPASLSGLVEFLYDLNNHPRLRLQEELLYDEHTQTDLQEISLSLTRDAERPFFMSTPRLKSADSMAIPMSFADPRIDAISAMRTRSGSLAELAHRFGISDGERDEFKRFFSTSAPRRAAPDYRGDGVRVRYFGHACVLLQSRDASILLDPMFAWEPGGSDGRFTFCDLPDRIDYVVLSHGHQDHCTPEMLLQLRHKVGRVLVPRNNSGSLADPSVKLMLTRLGFTQVDDLSAFDGISLPDGKITSLPFPGEHVDLDIHSRQGVYIELRNRRFAFLVDSDGWDSGLFRRIARRVGRRLDALFIGMECHGAPLTWLYGPLLTKPISRKNDESRRLSGLDSARAWNVVREFDAAQIFVYAMGQEPWMRYIMGLEYAPDSIQLKEMGSFLERCRRSSIPAENLFVSKEFELP